MIPLDLLLVSQTRTPLDLYRWLEVCCYLMQKLRAALQLVLYLRYDDLMSGWASLQHSSQLPFGLDELASGGVPSRQYILVAVEHKW